MALLSQEILDVALKENRKLTIVAKAIGIEVVRVEFFITEEASSKLFDLLLLAVFPSGITLTMEDS